MQPYTENRRLRRRKSTTTRAYQFHSRCPLHWQLEKQRMGPAPERSFDTVNGDSNRFARSEHKPRVTDNSSRKRQASEMDTLVMTVRGDGITKEPSRSREEATFTSFHHRFLQDLKFLTTIHYSNSSVQLSTSQVPVHLQKTNTISQNPVYNQQPHQRSLNHRFTIT
ncbi:hypothetical protein BJ508DRAFT_151873 [Ascobolus immersus RN42]|uniref:Uncharacterized protein n=1 Tax=Ascobolus immersus RN42 TaxID=1160509 RepID=A0A3N4HYC3_ASCIM|nr:hypothetical protein BJ508DRAFT_151873 [Ascobolus immersus RN42]